MNRHARSLITLVLVVAVAAGAWWIGRRSVSSPTMPATAADDVLYWYDPMRPEVHFDKPGRSPFMDMELIPKKRDSAESGSVTISSRVSQNLGIRVATATPSTVAPQVTVTGTIAADERRLAVVTVRADGWIERLDVRATGERVRRGQRIAGLYSPDLLAAQEEYLLALRTADSTLIPAARRRLELLGVSGAQAERIARGGSAERLIEIVALTNGVVTDLAVREGAAVEAGSQVLSLADLSEVWVIAEVPQSQAGWLRAGGPARVTLASGDAPAIEGRIDYVYPEVSAATRTVRARIVVPNAALTLQPGMTARVELEGEARAALLVPTEALIRSGERTAVIVAEGEGRFHPVAVVAGLEQGERTEIRRGLQAGDRVVVSGQFLIDSEANLRGALDRLLPPEPLAGDKQ